MLDSNGRAVLGRRIQLLVDSGPDFQTASRFHLHVATDANGRYEFRGIPVGAHAEVVVAIDEDSVDRSGYVNVQHAVGRGPDPIEMDDVVLPKKNVKAAERARITPLPGAAVHLPVAPTRAVCETVLREIGRDPVTPEMVDQAWLLTRPQFQGCANIKEMREALAEQEMIDWIDEIARGLTGKPADESLTLNLAPGCSVSGVVVDESGRSIPGADVQIRSPSRAGSRTRTRTNRDGRFRFGNVSPGRWTVFIQPLRQAPVHGTVVASANRPAESQFVVGPSSYISGRVIGPDGSPVEGALVGWAKPVNERGQEIEALEVNRTTTTAKDGAFRFGPISQGNYALTGLATPPRRTGRVTASANTVDAVIQLELEKRR